MKGLLRKLSRKSSKTGTESAPAQLDDSNVAIICHNSFLFEAMGLQFFKIWHLNQDNYQKGPTKSRFLVMVVILSILMTLVLSYVFYFGSRMSLSSLSIQEEETKKESKGSVSIKNIVSVMINYVMSSLFVTVIFVGVVQAYLSTKGYKKFIMNLKDLIEIITKNFNMTMDFINFSKSVSCRRIISLISFLTLYIISGYIYYMESNTEFFIRTAIGFIPVFFLVIVTLKIIFTIHLTTHFLGLLKKILYEMRTTRSYDPEPNEKRDKISVDKLLACRRIYNKLFENSEFINQKTGLTILCAILAFVFCITLSGYELFLLLTKESTLSDIISVLHPNIQCTMLLSGIVLNCQWSSNLVSVNFIQKF